MRFADRVFRRHTSLSPALAPIRFCVDGIFLAAILVFSGSAARGQALAPDQTRDTFVGAKALDSARQKLALQTADTDSHSETTRPLANGDSGESPAPLSSAARATIATTTPLDQSAPYEPITARERFGWGVRSAIWPEHLVAGVIMAGGGTGLNRPHEDGTHWGGFAERFGVRLTGVATSNVMEAGFGALWGEDPRYFRVPELSYSARVKNVIMMAFLARRPDGHFAPAYARFIAIPGNNFLTNAWRPDSEANVHDAVLRSLGGFAGRIVSNAWNEFWPQTKAYLFHRRDRQP